jgi:UDP:flavonoid glycosyltransferase YjiC (YdhE family)
MLLVTWDGGGNVPPLLNIGAELKARGHEVLVLGHERQRTGVAARGLGFRAYVHNRPWSAADPHPQIEIFELFLDGGAGADVEDVLAEWDADAILCDCLVYGGLQAAEASGRPTVALVHSSYGYFGQAWPMSPITEMGRAVGRVPTELLDAADEVIVATDRTLDTAVAPIPANVHWTGVAQPAIVPSPRTDPRRGLLSLSTFNFPGQPESLQALLDGLDGLDVQVLATIDESIGCDGLRVPANVEATGYAPHSEVMPEMGFVIGHGGHATTMLALAHGLPMLIAPQHPQLDQPVIGAELAAAGAAIVLPQHPTREEVRAAVREITENPGYAEAAAAIGARIRATDGTGEASDRIEALVSARALERAA